MGRLTDTDTDIAISLFYKKPKKPEKLGFRFFDFQVRFFYFFMSNSVNFYEFIKFVTFNIEIHELVYVYSVFF